MTPKFHARWTDDRMVPQALHDHLKNVGNRARLLAESARRCDAGFVTSAMLAGLLHDLGKYRTEFQRYLNAGDRSQKSSETDHAVYGAAAAAANWNELAIAFAVAGHHAGLHDECQLAEMVTGRKYQALDRFSELLVTADRADELDGLIATFGPDSEQINDPHASLIPDRGGEFEKRRFDVFVRMLFSTVVDADRLDSEKFEQEHRLRRTWERSHHSLDPEVLLARLEAARRAKSEENRGSRLELVQLRDEIFAACFDRAKNSVPGFFSLTVPTGGGKTIASMAFALEHARKHGLRRVIVVIPYLSIIEQNAREYRNIFGAEQVLEHHSAVEVAVAKTKPGGDANEPPQALDIERAMENWDVPIIVTTAVQFIETLFAASPSKARKLHNVARSVVIFDEVQTLPTHLLEPTLDVLRTLQREFGVSVVFCSATQPAFLRSANLRHGFQKGEVTEIAASPADLFQKLKRVQYRVEPTESRWNWDRLADEMLSVKRKQALAVVNLRQHAFDAFLAIKRRISGANVPGTTSKSLIKAGEAHHSGIHRTNQDNEQVFHLSSAMCAAHRLDLLGLSRTPPKNNVKQRLFENLPCWVISTQLIEAGVDVDFPTVFRAMGPLDSVVQAAGRCNREGKLCDDSGHMVSGEVIVFNPEIAGGSSGLPLGNYAKATAITPLYLKDTERLATDPELFAKYFNELFQITATDRIRPGQKTIQESRTKLDFRKVGDRAKVIEEDTIGVVVPYGPAKKLIDAIRRSKRIDRGVLRRLQRYMVNLRRGPKTLYEQLQNDGRLEPLLREIAEIPELDAVCYDLQLGIVFKGRSPEDFVQ